jgi:hypothetical protein
MSKTFHCFRSGHIQISHQNIELCDVTHAYAKSIEGGATGQASPEIIEKI